ncbi:MAG: ABC transporter substrate-binding protein [Deltaproteobacteria bacterium]|nr:ABC transporter substrate-binding protein [Deltaproteobacteria bacterium]
MVSGLAIGDPLAIDVAGAAGRGSAPTGAEHAHAVALSGRRRAACARGNWSQAPVRVKLLWLLAVALAAAACARPTDPRPTLGASTRDPEAEHAFRAAQTALDEGRPREAELRLRTFRERHPNDPLVPVAALLLGRIALEREDIPRARTLLAEAARTRDEVLRDRARFYDAVARHRAGDSRGAARILLPLVGRTTEPDETTLLLRTLAEAHEALGERIEALRFWDRLATETMPDDELAALRAGIVGLVEAFDPDELERALATLPPAGFAWPVAARRAIRRAYESGDLAGTRALVDRVEGAGLPLDDELRSLRTQAARREQVQPYAVGVVLPLSGRDRAIGQDALRGLMIAAGIPLRGPPRPDTFRLAVRDDTGDPARAATAVDELVREERVIAIVGPIAPDTAAAAAARAEALSVPIVLLTEPARLAGPTEDRDARRHVLRAFVSRPAEARALVAHAIATGSTRVAVVRPRGADEDALVAELRRQVAMRSGEIVADVTYGPDETSVTRATRGLRSGSFDALLIVHDGRGAPRAAQVEAALRESNGAGRPLVLWTTAEWEGQTVASLARDQPGAVVTRVRTSGPGSSGGEAELLTAWSAQFGGDPGIAASFAFDAFRCIRHVVRAGARSRSDALAALLVARFPDGSTAGRAFDEERALSPSVRVLRAVDGRLEPVGITR